MTTAQEGDDNEGTPMLPASTINEIEGDTKFLIGLDSQRHTRIRLDVLDNVCTRVLPGGNICISRPIKLGQVQGSGLLCIRMDEFERHNQFCVDQNRPVVPPRFQEYIDPDVLCDADRVEGWTLGSGFAPVVFF